MPTDNATRQAQALDRMRAEVPVDEPPVKKIKIRLSTSWVEVDVDINSLRDALGLPATTCLHRGFSTNMSTNQQQAKITVMYLFYSCLI